MRPRDAVIDHPVGDRDGEVMFHRVDRLHGFSTIVEDNARGAREFGVDYRSETHPIRRLSGIIDERKIGMIDFLKIDVEGAEGMVLSGLDLTVTGRASCASKLFSPAAWPMLRLWEPGLLASGYRLAFQDDLNRFYVAEERLNWPRDSRFTSGMGCGDASL